MNYSYEIASGIFEAYNDDPRKPEWKAVGYAGRCDGKNNPDMCDVPDVGPLPPGRYTIGKPIDHPKLGPMSFPLEPAQTNEMFDRSAFYIHGDSIEHPGEASEGCIVLPPGARNRIIAASDLWVVA